MTNITRQGKIAVGFIAAAIVIFATLFIIWGIWIWMPDGASDVKSNLGETCAPIGVLGTIIFIIGCVYTGILLDDKNFWTPDR